MSRKQEKIIIFDTTLRDGEQSAGAAMTAEEKIAIARNLLTQKIDINTISIATGLSEEEIKKVVDWLTNSYQDELPENINLEGQNKKIDIFDF